MFFHSTTFEGTTFHFSLTSLTSSHFTFTYVLGNNPNPPASVVHMTQSSSPPGSFSSVNIMLSKLITCTVNSSSFVANQFLLVTIYVATYLTSISMCYLHKESTSSKNPAPKQRGWSYFYHSPSYCFQLFNFLTFEFVQGFSHKNIEFSSFSFFPSDSFSSSSSFLVRSTRKQTGPTVTG